MLRIGASLLSLLSLLSLPAPLSLLLPLSLTAALPGQEVHVARLEDLLEQLGQDATAGAAAAELLRHGPTAVPVLASVLRGSCRTLDDQRRLQNVLYVLGRLGPAALPALPEVRGICGTEKGVLRRQAIWALAWIGPHAGPAERARCEEELRGVRRLDGMDMLRLAALQRVQEGPMVAADRVLTLVNDPDESSRLAAALVVVQGCLRGDVSERERLRRAFAGRLGEQLDVPACDFWRYEARRSTTVGELGAAAQELGESGPLVAAALMQHWDAEWRRKGLFLLVEVADAGILPRFDAASLLLWDADPDVQRRAADFARGDVTLPALRLGAASADAELAPRCRSALERERAALRRHLPDDPARAAEDLLWRAMTAENVAVPEDMPPAVHPVFVERLLGALWVNDEPSTLALLPFAQCCCSADAVRALLVGYYLGSDAVAVRALGQLRRQDLAVIAQVGDLQSRLIRATITRNHRSAVRVRAAMAWTDAVLRSARSESEGDLVALLRDHNAFAVLRAQVELGRRAAAGARSAAAVEVLAELVRSGGPERAKWELAFAAGRSRWTVFEPGITATVQAAASLALYLTSPEQWLTVPSAAAALAPLLEVDEAQVHGVLTRRTAAELAALLERLERDVVESLDIEDAPR